MVARSRPSRLHSLTSLFTTCSLTRQAKHSLTHALSHSLNHSVTTMCIFILSPALTTQALTSSLPNSLAHCHSQKTEVWRLPWIRPSLRLQPEPIRAGAGHPATAQNIFDHGLPDQSDLCATSLCLCLCRHLLLASFVTSFQTDSNPRTRKGTPTKAEWTHQHLLRKCVWMLWHAGEDSAY